MTTLSTTAAQSFEATRQPKALYYLFFAELWERFSFYGLRALLMLYMTRELLFSDSTSYGIYGAYCALVYASPMIGGYLADNFLGNRRAVFIGSFIIAAGHITLAMSFKNSLYYGLAFLVVGTGFFKANISSLLGQFYFKDDPRRDSGFTIFYMGINIGGFLAPLVCGYIGETYGWGYGFGMAAIGMLIGAVVFYSGNQTFGKVGTPPDPKALDKPLFLGLSINYVILIGALLMVPLGAYILQNYEAFGNFLNIFGIIAFGSLLVLTFKCNAEERRCLLTLLFMYIFVLCYFAAFEQVGSSINLFAERNIDRQVLGFTIPASWSQMLNPLFIILMSPLVSKIWSTLAKKNKEPLTPIKFSIGLILAGMGFYCLTVGIGQATPSGLVDIGWLVGGTLLFTLGELCVSPVGLSMVTKLAPARFTSLMMGAFFLSIAFSNHVAATIARVFGAPEGLNLSLDKMASLISFGNIFLFVAKFAFVAGIIVVIVTPLVRKTFKEHG